MKKIIKIFLLFFLMLNVSYAGQNPVQRSFKNYSLNYQDMYFKAFSAIKNNNFEVIEIQSQSGYILFSAQKREFLLEVLPSKTGSLVKIVPIDSDFQNSVGIFDLIFNVIGEAD